MRNFASAFAFTPGAQCPRPPPTHLPSSPPPPLCSRAALAGLTATPKTLPPWLFYDEAGSELFEQITTLPEYYLTRTERDILITHAAAIVSREVTVAELGAGTATKTGIHPPCRRRPPSTGVLYQPIDISPSALDEARKLEREIPGLTVRPQTANYITEPYRIAREPHRSVLALYIGSSIGNFSPAEAQAILTNLRTRLQPGDTLLLGTDLAPAATTDAVPGAHAIATGPTPGRNAPGSTKSIQTLLAAYDDAQGITAAFNRNILTHLNRELNANFDQACFAHRARWNPTESRIEMHLESLVPQTVNIPGHLPIHFAAGETIHTENSYKFTPASIATLLTASHFTPTHTLTDPQELFAVTLAQAI